MKLLKAITFALLAITFSCSQDDSQPEVPKVTTVYVGGFEYDENGKAIPTIWKDGVAEHLPIIQGSEGNVNAIFVDANDVYAVGHEHSSNMVSDYRAVMWKNGIKTTLNATVYGSAKSIFVSNGKTYIVGSLNNMATMWYSNTDTNLAGNGSFATSVYVKGNTIYIAGNETIGGTSKAYLWKNNDSLSFPIPFTKSLIDNSVQVNDVFYDGVNVYSAGYNFAPIRSAQLWKNNLASENYGDYSSMYAVFAESQNVYAVGSFTPFLTGKATLWKNNTPTTLSQNDSFAFDVFATSTNVYVAGYERTSEVNACIWKNGAIEILSNNISYANTVFVTEK